MVAGAASRSRGRLLEEHDHPSTLVGSSPACSQAWTNSWPLVPGMLMSTRDQVRGGHRRAQCVQGLPGGMERADAAGIPGLLQHQSRHEVAVLFVIDEVDVFDRLFQGGLFGAGFLRAGRARRVPLRTWSRGRSAPPPRTWTRLLDPLLELRLIGEQAVEVVFHLLLGHGHRSALTEGGCDIGVDELRIRLLKQVLGRQCRSRSHLSPLTAMTPTMPGEPAGRPRSFSLYRPRSAWNSASFIKCA